jgi:predicted RNA binding protein YcfA (HicA-like mRNA interferase family)
MISLTEVTATKKLKSKLQQGTRLKASEVRALLTNSGYTLARQKGSHEQWTSGGSTFTLACHGKEVPHYILDALKKITGA